MDLSRLQALLDRARGVTIAVVGDLMLDRYVYGEVSRISPEAPAPVLRGTHETAMLGGAGNVVRNLAAMGARVQVAGRLGTDAAGETVLEMLRALPGVSPFLDWRDGGRTTVKTRFVAGGQQLLRLDDEEIDDLDFGVSDMAAMALDGAEVILVSDYAKGYVSGRLMEVVLQAAGAQGARVIVDPKGTDFAHYGEVDLLKPNARELSAATGFPVEGDDETEATLNAAFEAAAAKAILVTRGARGASVMRRGEAATHVPARPLGVFDVSGAGDTSLAALGVALACGWRLEEAAEFAVLASGVAVSKPGTAVVTPAELTLAELSAHAAPAEAKVVTPDQAAAAAARWRAEGLRVGFTNGCFDVLHRGHVAYLAQARGWCDRLVVGLNSDASVRALKGEGRPVNDLEGRALVLAHLSSVDLVAPFDAPTPLALIEAVRPDVLVKGADYTREGVVGGDLVEGWGGQVRLAELVDGHSTTATLARLRAEAAE